MFGCPMKRQLFESKLLSISADLAILLLFWARESLLAQRKSHFKELFEPGRIYAPVSALDC